jgi:hypothetical protein
MVATASRLRNPTTEKGRQRLGLAVVGDEVSRVEDATPCPSWQPKRLIASATAHLATSEVAERESLVQAHKSAVALFWAGCALSLLRAQCKAKRHGAWAKLQREQGWARTTVNDAIRLYENAQTPDALDGLGIIEAKLRFVYPRLDDDKWQWRQQQAKRQHHEGDGGSQGRQVHS